MPVFPEPQTAPSEEVQAAAAWLRAQDPRPRPAIPALQQRFGLRVIDACAAQQIANGRRPR